MYNKTHDPLLSGHIDKDFGKMKQQLLLISGLLSNQILWSHQLEHLSDIAAIQVKSPIQDTPKKMVQAILEEAPEHFALAGHSMGGWLCLEVMRVAPSRVSKLCLLNTTAKLDTVDKKAKREEMIHRAENGQFQEVVKEIVDHFVFNTTVKEDVEKMLLDAGERVFIQQEKSMLIRSESQSILPSIQCPTLVIHSAQDKVFSFEDHKVLVDHIQNARLAIVEDCGHMSPLEIPQAVTTLLRYWLTYF